MSEPKRTGLMQMLKESSGSQFVIPVYQRNYAWTADKDVKQYLIDLENVLKGKYKNHFLGILIYLEKTISFSTRELSVIDGQQRLTTTFLVIYAIKELFKEDINLAKQLQDWYLTNPYCDEKIKYKLKPLVSDDDVYRCIVEDRFKDIEDKSSNVYKNYCYIIDSLKQLRQKRYSANDILLALNKLYVVCVPIDAEDNPQKIFESINATGEKLTAADLIRNLLLMNLESDVQEEYYTKYWKQIEDNVSIDSKELEKFFRMYLAVKMYRLVSKNSVYREFVVWKENNNLTIEVLFEELVNYAQVYSFVNRDPINVLGKKLAGALLEYRQFGSEMPLSIVMEFTKLYFQKKIDEETLADLILSINSYLIRRSICDLDTQNISRLFPDILKNIVSQCGDNYDDIVELLNQYMVGNTVGTSGSYMPTDKQMEEILHSANVYQRQALRIIFNRIELDHNPAPVDLSMLSVEHLMPQTPTEAWYEALQTDEETYLANLHRLGNLTLAASRDNSKMANKVWEYKNEVLKETAHIKMNEKILEVDKWDLECIEKRTNELIQKICELYPYPDVSIVTTSDDSGISDVEARKVVDDVVQKKYCWQRIKKGHAYCSSDSKDGYVVITSKKYGAGSSENYWFAYNELRFRSIEDYANKNMVFVCRGKKILIVSIPKKFTDEYRTRMPVTLERSTGDVRHYHIKIYKDLDSKVYLYISQPQPEKIDISEYVIGEF